MPNYGPKIVSDSLILCADAAHLKDSHAKVNTNNIVTEIAFASEGGSGEELIERGTDPWGRIAFLDRSVDNDGSSGYDGGDTSNVYDGIDSAEKYRFTYFFRVDRKGSNGTLYFGLYGYNSSTSNIGVHNNGGSAGGYSTTNPYFSYPGHNLSKWQEGRWYMFVAYVHPVGSTSPTDDTAGFYDMVTGEKVTGISTGNVQYNAVWVSGTTKTRFRYYLYYSTDSNVAMSWYQARIEQVNGNEPTIEDMLNECPDRLVNLAGDGKVFQARNGQGYESTYKSISFNGSNQYLDLGTDFDFKTTAGWTVSSWVKYDNVPGAYNNTTSPGNFIGAESINESSWYWSVLTSKLALWDKGGGAWYYGNTTLSADTWYHATLVSDPNNTHYYCYLNGEDDMSSGWSSHNGSWTDNNGLRIRYIGRGNSSNVRYVDGNIACTHAWSRALTAAEVRSNFNAQKERFGL
jgi:hypothetical protein